MRNIRQKLIMFSRENSFGADRREMRCDTGWSFRNKENRSSNSRERTRVKQKIKSEDSIRDRSPLLKVDRLQMLTCLQNTGTATSSHNLNIQTDGNPQRKPASAPPRATLPQAQLEFQVSKDTLFNKVLFNLLSLTWHNCGSNSRLLKHFVQRNKQSS